MVAEWGDGSWCLRHKDASSFECFLKASLLQDDNLRKPLINSQEEAQVTHSEDVKNGLRGQEAGREDI